MFPRQATCSLYVAAQKADGIKEMAQPDGIMAPGLPLREKEKVVHKRHCVLCFGVAGNTVALSHGTPHWGGRRPFLISMNTFDCLVVRSTP